MYTKLLRATITWFLLGVVTLLGRLTGRKIRFALLAASAVSYAYFLVTIVMMFMLALILGSAISVMLAGALLALYIAGGLWAFPQINRYGIELQEMGSARIEAQLRKTLDESLSF